MKLVISQFNITESMEQVKNSRGCPEIKYLVDFFVSLTRSSRAQHPPSRRGHTFIDFWAEHLRFLHKSFSCSCCTEYASSVLHKQGLCMSSLYLLEHLLLLTFWTAPLEFKKHKKFKTSFSKRYEILMKNNDHYYYNR